MCIRDSILVCINVFSKAVRLYTIMRPTTKVVLKILLQKYIPLYGKMKVLSDQGVQFQSEKWERTLRENGIQPVSYTHLDVYKRQSYSGSLS